MLKNLVFQVLLNWTGQVKPVLWAFYLYCLSLLSVFQWSCSDCSVREPALTSISSQSIEPDPTTDKLATKWATPAVGKECYFRGVLMLHDPETVIQSISEFDCAVRFSPEYAAKAHRGLGKAYAEINRYEKALHHFQAYLSLKRDAEDRQKILKEIESLQRTIKEQQ